MPERVQLSRRRGWRMPPNTKSVARPHRYGNPFKVTPSGVDDYPWVIRSPLAADHILGLHETEESARAHAVELYELHVGPMGLYELDLTEVSADLGGYNLACFCPLPADGEPDICHAAILLRLANTT